MKLLECKNFAVEIGDKQIFEPIELVVRASECHQLLGPNGSGKTACLKAFTGLFAYNGYLAISEHSYLGHNPGLYNELTSHEMIEWWQTLIGRQIKHNFRNQYISSLSAGQKQQLAWLRLEHENSNLWLLDEALTNLDPANKEQKLLLIKKHLNTGGSIIMTSHMPEYWQDIITHSKLIKGILE